MLQINNPKAAKKSARALEKFLAKSGVALGHGKALDAIAVLSGFKDWNSMARATSPEAMDSQLDGFELSHVEHNQDVEYGEECAAVIHTGFELRYSAQGDLVDYVRVCDPLGREIAYWVSDEWQEDPQLVMGAILGALVRGRPELRGKASSPVADAATGTATPAAGSVTLLEVKNFMPRNSDLDLGNSYGMRVVTQPESPQVRIQDVSLEDVSNVLVNGVPYAVRYHDTTNLALLHEAAGDSDAEADAHYAALELSRIEDGLEWEDAITLDTLRSLTWDAVQKCFVSPDGDRYEFFIEKRFSPVAAVQQPRVIQVVREAPAEAKPKKSIRKPKLFGAEVSARGHDDDAHLGTWFGIALNKKDVRAKALDELWDARLDCAGCRAIVEIDEQAEADHSPFQVFTDGNVHIEVESLAQAVTTAENLLSNGGYRCVSLKTVDGTEILKLMK